MHVAGKNFNPFDHIIVSYYDKIRKKKFKILSNKLNEIKFIALDNEYLTDYEDVGGDRYIITYNQNKQKNIRREF